MSTQRFPTLVDGRLYAPGAGVVSTDDPGFLLGLAVFETLLYEHGTAHFLGEHLARLARGLAWLGIELPRERDPALAVAAYRPALDARLRELGEGAAALRLTVTRGVTGADGRRRPTVVIAAREVVPPPADGVVVTFEPHAKRSGDPLEEIKSTSRLRNVLALEAARAKGAWDALLGNERDDVCEATIANVWAVVDGVVRTPDLASGCLGGVTREHLVTEVPRLGRELRVGPLAVRELARASEVFLSNTTGRVIPVRAVLGVVDGLAGPSGPVAGELREALRRSEERYRSTHPVEPGL